MFHDEDGTVTPGILQVRFRGRARGVALTRGERYETRWRPQIRLRSGCSLLDVRRWPAQRLGLPAECDPSASFRLPAASAAGIARSTDRDSANR